MRVVSFDCFVTFVSFVHPRSLFHCPPVVVVVVVLTNLLRQLSRPTRRPTTQHLLMCDSAATSAAKSSVPLDEHGKPLKPCCACPETKQARDLCMVQKGEEACAAEIAAHKVRQQRVVTGISRTRGIRQFRVVSLPLPPRPPPPPSVHQSLFPLFTGLFAVKRFQYVNTRKNKREEHRKHLRPFPLPPPLSCSRGFSRK